MRHNMQDEIGRNDKTHLSKYNYFQKVFKGGVRK